ncbi:MAG: molybdenum cofactor biosynthesis protein B [Gemmatimonadota bacterium]
MTRSVPAAVLTVSDRCSRGETPDASGAFLVSALREAGYRAELPRVVPDEATEITRALLRLADEEGARLILTTGGTGLSPRDVTPEATRPLLEREAPGIAEALRARALRATPHGMLSRGLAGARGEVLIVNLPGSLKAVREAFEVLAPVLPHALELLSGSGASPADHAPPLAAGEEVRDGSPRPGASAGGRPAA